MTMPMYILPVSDRLYDYSVPAPTPAAILADTTVPSRTFRLTEDTPLTTPTPQSLYATVVQDIPPHDPQPHPVSGAIAGILDGPRQHRNAPPGIVPRVHDGTRETRP